MGTEKIDDDGTAFLRVPEQSSVLTKRDFFAAAALPAVINDSWRNSTDLQDSAYKDGLANGIASDAYEIADAMTAERNKSK